MAIPRVYLQDKKGACAPQLLNDLDMADMADIADIADRRPAELAAYYNTSHLLFNTRLSRFPPI